MSRCNCACHDAVCVRCACLHRSCGWWCDTGRAVQRWLRRTAKVMALRPCLCGHPRSAHEHYRRGSDCAACACLIYRPVRRPSWYRPGEVTSWLRAQRRAWRNRRT